MLGGLIHQGLGKLGFKFAAEEFRHYLDGSGKRKDFSAAGIAAIKASETYKDKFMAEMREKCKEQKETSGAYSFRAPDNTDMYYYLGVASFVYKVGVQSWKKDTCTCPVSVSVDDPYDFHLGKDAKLSHSKKVEKFGRTITGTVNVTMPDSVIISIGTHAGAKKFERKGEWDDLVTFTKSE